MNKVIQLGIYAIALSTGVGSFADDQAQAAAWGSQQLKESVTATVPVFKEKFGADAGKSASLILVTKGELTASVAITYKDEALTKTSDFTCKGSPVACKLNTLANVAESNARANVKWGIDELKTSAEFALNEFKESHGADEAKATQVSIKKNIQGNAAKVLIQYGAAEPQEYFCHNHGDHIDCH